MGFVRMPVGIEGSNSLLRWRVMKYQSDRSPEGDMKTGGVVIPKLGANASRRRFIKGSALGVPVVLTLTSRPVLGFEQACMSPSRMISGNHSGLAGLTPCTGNTRAFWGDEASSTSPPNWTDFAFTDVFGSTYPYVTSVTDSPAPTKLGAVLLDSLAGHDTNSHSIAGFASYIIAAYLNALNDVGGVSTVLNAAQVVYMWNDVIGTGQFCPQDGMCWGATGVIGYLTNSGIVPS